MTFVNAHIKMPMNLRTAVYEGAWYSGKKEPVIGN